MPAHATSPHKRLPAHALSRAHTRTHARTHTRVRVRRPDQEARIGAALDVFFESMDKLWEERARLQHRLDDQLQRKGSGEVALLSLAPSSSAAVSGGQALPPLGTRRAAASGGASSPRAPGAEAEEAEQPAAGEDSEMSVQGGDGGGGGGEDWQAVDGSGCVDALAEAILQREEVLSMLRANMVGAGGRGQGGARRGRAGRLAACSCSLGYGDLAFARPSLRHPCHRQAGGAKGRAASNQPPSSAPAPAARTCPGPSQGTLPLPDGTPSPRA